MVTELQKEHAVSPQLPDLRGREKMTPVCVSYITGKYVFSKILE